LSDIAFEVRDWFAARAERVIETACAWVFLLGGAAYKLKRPVNPGYADFSTPELRLWALERELAFNQATAPDIYRRVHAVTRTADGGFELSGAGPVCDHVLEMRRFPDEAVLAARPEALDGEMAEMLGRTIARFHAAAPLRAEAGIAFTVPSNASLLRELAAELGAAEVVRLIELTEAEHARQRPRLDARAHAGFARRCHGDLHLGNILVEADRPVLFDCIEFNDALSDLDVLYDLAFLLMDLDFRGNRSAAVRVMSAYLDEASRLFPESHWEGLAALPLMLSIRAAVRAHVSAHSGEMEIARRYVAAALRNLSPAPPTLAAVGGLSGAGKSSVARAIAPGLEPAPGAVILRSDEIRKRLAGVAPSEPAPAQAYAPEATAGTYAAMFETARKLLAAGCAVVLDATFLDPAMRARAEQLAAEAGVPFQGLWLEAPLAVLAARVAGRRGDASDADVAALRGQAGRDPGEIAWARFDARRAPEETAARWREALAV
jgi:hypothetical protein